MTTFFISYACWVLSRLSFALLMCLISKKEAFHFFSLMLLLMYPLMTYAKAQNFNTISTLLTTDRYTVDPKTPSL
jgi:hypothetical protein